MHKPKNEQPNKRMQQHEQTNRQAHAHKQTRRPSLEGATRPLQNKPWLINNLFCANPRIFLFCGAVQDPLGDLEKTLKFQVCLQGSKNQKNGTEGLRKTQKVDPRITKKNDFCDNTTFATHSEKKQCFKRIRLWGYPLQNRCKKTWNKPSKQKTKTNPSES